MAEKYGMITTYGFQSLIGRLKTKAGDPEPMEVVVFQSLIGRLKTNQSSFAFTVAEQVSIPHR